VDGGLILLHILVDGDFSSLTPTPRSLLASHLHESGLRRERGRRRGNIKGER